MNEDILIVDDNPENLKLLNQLLEEENYRIRIANNGKQAIRSLENRLPDLLLLDIMMPEMNGFETLNEINYREEHDFPVIFLSALDNTFDKLKAFELGAVDYIEKPFSIEEVKARVKLQLTVRKQKQRIIRQNRELKMAKKKLQENERLALLGELSAKITHEINNPINYIHAGIEAISKDLIDLTDYYQRTLEIVKQAGDPVLYKKVKEPILKESFEELRASITETLNQTKQGSRRVAQIIGSLKQSYSRTDIKKAACNPASVIKEALDVIKTISTKNIKYSLQLNINQKIICSSQQVFQVFLNLLANAEEVVDKEGEIRILAWEEDKQLFVNVEDDGGGVDEEIQKSIFEPYFTTKAKTKESGNGLGLSICKGIVKEMEGELWYESRNNWSLFRMKFPLVEEN
ncbi:MAG: response regulator [Vicingaceae bacterium]